MNNKNRSIIALDVGGSSVKSAIITDSGKLIGDTIITFIDSKAEADDLLGSFVKIINRHLNASIEGIVFGFPGPFDYEEGICWIVDLKKYEALYGLNLKIELTNLLRIKIPILFRNDAEAAIVGEALYGAARHFNRFIGITLGTGLGSTFIEGGKPVTKGPGLPEGRWLFPVIFHGIKADDVFSTRGLQARMVEMGIDGMDIYEAAEHARRGNMKLQNLFLQFGKDLGEFLRPFVQDFSAEALLVLGGIAKALDIFQPTLQGLLQIPMLGGKLGNKAALFGAANLFFK
jgi:glucokinase